MKKISLVILSTFLLINFAQIVLGSERCPYYPNYYSSYLYQYNAVYTTCSGRCCSTLYPTTISAACCSSNSYSSFNSISSVGSSSSTFISIQWWWIAAPVLGFIFICVLPIIIGISICCCINSKNRRTRLIAPVNQGQMNTIRADIVVQLPEESLNKNNLSSPDKYNQQAGQPDLTLPAYPFNNDPVFNHNTDHVIPVLPNSTVGTTGPANPSHIIY